MVTNTDLVELDVRLEEPSGDIPACKAREVSRLGLMMLRTQTIALLLPVALRSEVNNFE